MFEGVVVKMMMLGAGSHVYRSEGLIHVHMALHVFHSLHTLTLITSSLAIWIQFLW